jgi:outer membrane protein, adhesin transport system
MNKFRFVKVACISIIASASLQAVSLKESVDRVLSSNPEVIAEKNNQEAFKKYIDERRGNYYPRIDIDGRLEKSNTDDKYDSTSIYKSGSSQEDGYNVGIALNQILYDGDLTPSQVRQAKYNDLANKYRTDMNIDNVVLETITAYIGLAQYDEMLELTKNMIATNEENLQIAKEKESISGEVLETFQVDSKLNFVKEKYIEEKDLKTSRINTFKRYVGIEPTGNECRPKIDLSKIPNDLQKLIEMTVSRNYEIQQQIETIKSQREKIAQADAKFLPTLSLELKVLTDNDLALNEEGKENQAYGRIKLAWNIYNGGGDYAVSKQEELFLAEQKQRLDAITNKVVEAMKVNYQRFLKNKERIDVLKKYVVANENIVQVYKSEFEAGTRTFVDILDAQTVLYEAKISLVNREYELYTNYYAILNSLSMLTPTVLDPNNDICSDKQTLNIKTSEKKQEVSNDLRTLLGDEPTPVKKEMIKQEVIPVAKDVSSKMAKGSFLDAPAGYYTINVTTTNGLNAANAYINENNLTGANAYSFGPEMNNTKVIYGIFKTVEDAKSALNNLPVAVKASQPYIDNMAKHQKLYLKYNKE